MAYHLSDFLIRRTGKIFFDRINAEKQIDYLFNFLSLQLNTNGTARGNEALSVKQEFDSAVAF